MGKSKTKAKKGEVKLAETLPTENHEPVHNDKLVTSTSTTPDESNPSSTLSPNENSKLYAKSTSAANNNNIKIVPQHNSLKPNSNGSAVAHKNTVANNNHSSTSSSLPRATPMMPTTNSLKPMPMTSGTSSSNNLNSSNGVVLNQMGGGRRLNNSGPDYQRLQVQVKPGSRRPRRPHSHSVRMRGEKRLLYADSYKVIALICGIFACLLLIMALAASEWLIEPGGYRQGLFVYCLPKLLPNVTVPFVNNRNPDLTSEGCHRIDLGEQAYTLVAAAFVVVSLLVNIFATLLTVLGLRCRDPNNKYKYYRIAVYVMAVALVAILVALVVYPVCFANIMENSSRLYWEFGWAYGVAWGAAIFLFGGVILLLCDKESEEIYYKERTIVQYADTNNKV